MIVAFFVLAAALIIAAAGVRMLVGDAMRQRSLILAAVDTDGLTAFGRGRRHVDRALMRTRLGVLLSVALEQAGLRRFRAIDGMAAIVGVMIAVFAFVAKFLSLTLAPIVALSIIPLVVAVVRRERQQRREKFIAQMPQLARVLSNATSAGLALRTAIELAAEELPEPASSEMSRVAQALSVGESIENALTTLERRLPSREVVVLVSTLIVSARAGGSLISSLRRIAETLDERKQTRREILTSLAEARSTAMLIPVIGIASLFMLRSIDPNAIDTMLSRPVGQLIFLAAAVMYTIGFFLFKRITRVDV